MSTYGIGSSTIARPSIPLRENGRTGGARTVEQPRTERATSNARPANAPATSSSLPAEAPQGTDPALWSVLSSEERGYFAKLGAMGPLTYGRAMDDIRANQSPSIRGGRLDLKV